MADYLHDCLLDLLHITYRRFLSDSWYKPLLLFFDNLVDVYPDMVYLIREIL